VDVGIGGSHHKEKVDLMLSVGMKLRSALKQLGLVTKLKKVKLSDSAHGILVICHSQV